MDEDLGGFRLFVQDIPRYLGVTMPALCWCMYLCHGGMLHVVSNNLPLSMSFIASSFVSVCTVFVFHQCYSLYAFPSRNHVSVYSCIFFNKNTINEGTILMFQALKFPIELRLLITYNWLADKYPQKNIDSNSWNILNIVCQNCDVYYRFRGINMQI